MIKQSCKINKKGFTLLEVMVATALFLIVMMGGITALVNVMKTHKTTKAMREQIDTLSVVMEDMVRNIRLGTNFHCDANSGFSDIETPLSCPETSSGTGYQKSFMIAFEGLNGQSGNPDDQIVYRLVIGGDGKGYIIKSREGDSNDYSNDPKFKRITPPSINFDPVRSGFTVFNAEHSDASDVIQPRIILRLVGTASYQEVNVPFNIQTVVTPRTPDA